MGTLAVRPQSRIKNLVTAEELERLPSNPRYELIRGELSRMPNNSAERGNKTIVISAYVVQFVLEHNLGECFAAETRFTVAQNPGTVLGPDFAFISAARLAEIPETGYLKFAPDLVVETRSPGDTRREYAFKVALWLEHGAAVVWALDPRARTLTVHRRNEAPATLLAEDTLVEPDLLPGFSLDLGRLFRPPTTAP